MIRWVRETLGQICAKGGGQIQTGPFGSQLHEFDYRPEGIPVIMPADIVDGKIATTRIARIPESHVERLRRHKLAKGDIVYGRRGDIGRQALIRDENIGWLCGTGCLKISLGNRLLNSEFLHHYLSTKAVVGWIKGQSIGATMPNLNTDILKRVPVFYPADQTTQKKIAATLSAYDDLIENNCRRIALLEKIVEEIYREWFVRMRFPGHEQEKFKKGVPEGWREIPSSEVFDVLGGGTPKTDMPAYWNGEIPFFTPKDATENYYVLKTEQNITEKGLESCSSRLYPKDTIFITARGTVGKLALANRAMAMNQSCYALASKKRGKVFFCFLTIRNAIAYVKGVSKSGVFDNIIVDTFKTVPLLMPKPELVEEFNNAVTPLFHQASTLLKTNKLLIDKRDKLLPRLISGKLNVENLDIQYPPSILSQAEVEKSQAAHD